MWKKCKTFRCNRWFPLYFDKHLSEICIKKKKKKKKASQQLNILKWIGTYLNRLGRLTNYYSFILSNFDYCPVTWHLCSEKIILKKLKKSRKELKIIHKQSPSYLHDLISITDQKYNVRHYWDKAVLPRVRTARYGLNSFQYNAAQIWNELPNHFRQETSLEHFKNIIHTWNDSSCQCSACRWPLNFYI
jgi:hypothetical protein